MNKDFKYLLENCREESLVDGVFTFNTPDGWKRYKKKRAIDKAVLENIIEPVTKKDMIYYRMCDSVADEDSSSCDSVADDNNEFAELSEEELFKQSIKVFNMLSYYSTTLKSKEHALSPEFLKKLADLQDDFCIALKDCGFKDRDIVKYF